MAVVDLDVSAAVSVYTPAGNEGILNVPIIDPDASEVIVANFTESPWKLIEIVTVVDGMKLFPVYVMLDPGTPKLLSSVKVDKLTVNVAVFVADSPVVATAVTEIWYDPTVDDASRFADQVPVCVVPEVSVNATPPAVTDVVVTLFEITAVTVYSAFG